MQPMRFGAALVGLMAIGLSSRLATADTCYYYETPDQGDDFIMSGWGCGQIYINDMWSRFTFHTDDWDDGFGYDDACNNALPLARTFNALQLLGYSHTSTPNCGTSGNFLDWVYCWAGNAFEELEARCGNGTERAYTSFGGFSSYTHLYLPFFYEEDVVQRAGTLVHEARHAEGWCSHECSCPRGGSCDPNFGAGCTGWFSSDGMGTNAYQVIFLNWYATTATWATDALKASAVIEANYILDQGFCTDPCFRLDSSGYPYQVC